MKTTVHGIHHVTAIAGDAQENLEFYVGVMGRRLVKKTVNQDAPDTYHLFYADGAGTPGTDLTFFPWSDMGSASLGIGLTVEVPFAILSGRLKYWRTRFNRMGVKYGEVELRFGETTLPFWDPHGLPLSLVESDDKRQFIPWEKGPIPPEHQLRGMHLVRLWECQLAPMETLLTERMGFMLIGTENGWCRYGVEGGGSGKIIELKELPKERRGTWGTGGVHHVAWRMRDSDEEMVLRGIIERAGLHPTSQIDRFWFRSVYFKEPGGALFELATDGPGFDRDEEMERLGERLILPILAGSQSR